MYKFRSITLSSGYKIHSDLTCCLNKVDCVTDIIRIVDKGVPSFLTVLPFFCSQKKTVSDDEEDALQ